MLKCGVEGNGTNGVSMRFAVACSWASGGEALHSLTHSNLLAREQDQMGASRSAPIAVQDTRKESRLAAREHIMRAREDLDRVECFVMNVFACCPRVESMWLILSSKLGHLAFQNFTRSEMASEFLDLFIDTSELLTVTNIDNDLIAHFFHNIAKKLFETETPIPSLLPPSLKDELLKSHALTNEEKVVLGEQLLSLIGRLQSQLVYIMARDLFNRFLFSKDYKKWRAAEKSHALATTCEDASLSTHTFSIHSSFISTASSKFSTRSMSSKNRHRMRTVLKPRDSVATALAAVIDSDLQRILSASGSENWLSSLLAASETLPIVFALADLTDFGCRDPPLLFVNRHFERVTGHDREKALGRGLIATSLCDNSEQWIVEELLDALSSGRSGVTAMTCQVVSGTGKQVFAYKPLLDINDEHCYTVCLRIDAGRDLDAQESRFRIAQELLDMIPGKLTVEVDAISVGEDEEEYSDEKEEKSGCLSVFSH